MARGPDSRHARQAARIKASGRPLTAAFDPSSSALRPGRRPRGAQRIRRVLASSLSARCPADGLAGSCRCPDAQGQRGKGEVSLVVITQTHTRNMPSVGLL
ncbi:hypothetical protein GCM10022399_11850 [Terrabacter ginsenosidimutans]|uniref:Uncharacterized protein n=1 Tax=Terrabacter ginsenosidimutans TaxID=490575 RepID=A0ABP7CYT1_9MICO